jgi:PAS domain S-box-containing protein
MLDDSQRAEQIDRDEKLAAAQRSVLESLALERPLTEVLERIVALAESTFPDLVCAVLVADTFGALRYLVAPSLPDSLLSQSARVRRLADPRPTVENVDSLRDAYQALVESLDSSHPDEGLHACWRKLLCKADRSVIGAFEVFCKQDRELRAREAECLESFMRLVHVTISNDYARRCEHLRSVILDSVEDAILFLEVEGQQQFRFISVNQSFTRIFGVQQQEMVGRTLDTVLPQARHSEIFAHFAKANETGTPQHWEEVLQARTGEKHGEITIVPIFDKQGQCTNFVGAIHDVTARVLAERDRAQLHRKLHQAQRMQALGTLAGGIAHDFNNILAAIGGNARVLLDGVPQDWPLRKRIDAIDTASTRAVDLVRQILTFSRHATPSYRVFDPRVVAEEALNLLRSTLPPNVQIVTAFAADAPNIKADPTQFHQILINLITNAAYASTSCNGPIEVALDPVRSVDLPANLQGRQFHPQYLQLRVTDRGIGMDAATLKRAFEPFFTTRAPGEGTGLGLSVVHGIVESHDGLIDLTSSRANGTEVRVYLPAVEISEEERSIPTVEGGQGERVMYVDDEEGLVELMGLALTKLGYRFVGFCNPVAALNAFAANPDEVDVVITDIAMPQMSGTQLAKKLRAIRGELPIIMTSGYIRAEDRRVAEQLCIDQLIYKSNTIDELAAAIAVEIKRLHTEPS